MFSTNGPWHKDMLKERDDHLQRALNFNALAEDTREYLDNNPNMEFSRRPLIDAWMQKAQFHATLAVVYGQKATEVFIDPEVDV